MTIEVICNACGEETSLCGFLINHDIKHTQFKALFNKEGFEINGWIEKMKKENRVKEVNGIIYVDGEPILDEMERFERNPVCPECGSADCFWV